MQIARRRFVRRADLPEDLRLAGDRGVETSGHAEQMRGGLVRDERAHLGDGRDLVDSLVDLDAVAGREDHASVRVAQCAEQALARVESGVALMDDAREELGFERHCAGPYGGKRETRKLATEVFPPSPRDTES